MTGCTVENMCGKTIPMLLPRECMYVPRPGGPAIHAFHRMPMLRALVKCHQIPPCATAFHPALETSMRHVSSFTWSECRPTTPIPSSKEILFLSTSSFPERDRAGLWQLFDRNSTSSWALCTRSRMSLFTGEQRDATCLASAIGERSMNQ